MDRTVVCIGLVATSLGISLAAPGVRAFSLEKPFVANVALTANGRETVRLQLAPGAHQLEVRVRGRMQRLELPTLDLEIRGDLKINDFNFDGFADIAIPSSIGYGGVNYFYDLYVFQPAQSRFVPLEFPRDGQLCNPELRVATRTIETDCKDGPKYEFRDFRFVRGKPYVYRSAEMVILEGFDADQYLAYAVSVFNPDGTLAHSSLSDDPRRENPPLRYVPIASVTLYDAPREDARTSRYIVRGDAVRILKARDADGQQWLRVAYQSRTLGRIVKWVSFNR